MPPLDWWGGGRVRNREKESCLWKSRGRFTSVQNLVKSCKTGHRLNIMPWGEIPVAELSVQDWLGGSETEGRVAPA